MNNIRVVRSVAASEREQRFSVNVPWMLVPLIALAILARGWGGPCWAEERQVVENSIGMKLVSIPAGEFLMGGPEKEIATRRKYLEVKVNEAVEKPKDNATVQDVHPNVLEEQLPILPSMGPQHRVVITKPFWLGTYSVTQQEFTKVMGFNPSAHSANSTWTKYKDIVKGMDTSRFPVECVTWDEAAEFCRQLSALPEEVAAGRSYRLPTEAEWEYACRAGTTTSWYWGNDGEKDAPDYASIHIGRNKIKTEAERKKFDAEKRTHPVGEKKPNPWGLFDMIGNVQQWCTDWYDAKAYTIGPQQDPTGPSSGTGRITRGAVFFATDKFNLKSWIRSKQATTIRKSYLGFRVACDVSAPPPVVKTVPETSSMKDAEARLKEKGLTRRSGYFLLPEEAPFIRYVTTIERLRMSCYHAQKECQDAQRQLGHVQSAKASAIQSRMQARSAIGYSDTWREHWAAVRARNQASDAAMLVDLSKEGVQKWQQDAQADLDSVVELFSQQIDKLQKMYQKLQADYAKLYEDKTVKHTLVEVNSQGKTTYRIGPTPSAAAAMKKLEHEQGLLAQFKKN